jgi:uncharacterized protein (TIGR03083 family)
VSLLSPAEHLGRLLPATDRFAEVLATADLISAVPSCPGWDLTRLAWHLGDVHRWARRAVVDGHPGDEPDEVGPRDRDELVAWYREGAGGLVDALRGADPASGCWTFGPKPRTASFWFRRQDHETWMHLWDAANAAAAASGGPPTGEDPFLEPALAADGIDEVATMFLPRQVRLGRIPPLPRALAVQPDDADGRWVLSGDGTADVRSASGTDAAAEACLRGPAEVLLLLLWRRVDLTDPRIVVDGDPVAARDVLACALTP